MMNVTDKLFTKKPSLRCETKDIAVAEQEILIGQKACPDIDAPDRIVSDISEEKYQYTQATTSGLSVSVARCDNQPDEPGLEYGYDIHPDGKRIRVFDGNYGWHK